jgi:predicted ATPase
VLGVDDLQWCDQETLEWLHFLLHYEQQAPLLLVATLRLGEIREEHPLTGLLLDLRKSGQLEEIGLGPLTAEETVQLAERVGHGGLVRGQEMPLYNVTEGNPLFVVEMVRAGLGSNGEGKDRAGLPPQLQATIQARLVQLTPAARDVARLASAVGREFSFDILLHASDSNEEALVVALEELWQRHIVREHTTGTYDFSHGQIRDVAYGEVSTIRRRLLHRRIAQALEAIHQHTLEAVSGQVATHYELAGLYEQAIPWFQRAAEAAAQVYANAEAIRYYRHALTLLENLAGQPQTLTVTLYERLGEILHLIGQYDEARIAYRRLLAQVSLSDPITQARLHRKIGNTWREQYRYGEAQESYAAAEHVLGEAPHLAPHDGQGVAPQTGAVPMVNAERLSAWWWEWIQILLEMNLVYYWLGQVQEGAALLQRLHPVIDQYATLGQRSSFIQNRILLEFRLNRNVATEEMIAWAQEMLALVQKLSNQADIPSAQFLLGFILLWHGNSHGAMELLQATLQLAEQTGDVSLQARCLTYLAIAHRQCGRLEETRQSAAHSLAVAMAAHMPEYMGMARANLAWVAWRTGDLQGAGEHGRTALELWHQLPSRHASAPFQWTALWPLIVVALHEGQLATAIDYLRILLDPTQQRLPDTLTALLEQAIHTWERGEMETARALLAQSVSMAQQLHYL